MSGKDLKLESAIKIRKYLEKDYVTFLAHIVDKGANVKSIQNIPIERNHIEIFSEDLSGLPPTRIVEFQIDLVPGGGKGTILFGTIRNARAVRSITRTLSKGLITPSSSS
ncbi:hypothetical protein Tco_0028325 [Tanacetum coccineum]